MPVDYKSELTASMWTLLRAVGSFGTTFKAGNQYDERNGGSARQRLANRAPADFPNISVEIVGGDQQATRTPTFGLTGPTVSGSADAIIPITVTMRILMRFVSQKSDTQTAAETIVRQGLHTGYPKLGLSYVRDFTIRERRTPTSKAPMAIAETQWDIPVTMRLHLSQLR